MKNLNLQMSADLIDAINGELRYTECLQEMGRADEEDYGVEGQLITLSTYTRKALDAWTMNASDEEARKELRKVAAIACRALLLGGVIPREGFEQ